MTTRKAAPDKTDDTGNEAPKDEDAKPTDDGHSSDDTGLGSRIRTMVEEAVDAVLGNRSESAGRHTQGDDEEELYRRVKGAQERIKKEEEKEGRLHKVEEKLEKVFEKPPARDGFGGKIERWFWGSRD